MKQKIELKIMILVGVLCLNLLSSAIANKMDGKMSGLYDIQYRRGDSYKTSGNDKFVINALYLKFDKQLDKNIDSRFCIDGADLAKESTTASQKYVEEAYIRFKNVADRPLTIIFGKDEMPYGQDYENSLFDPLKHQLEIDKVWGLNATYKINNLIKLQSGVWEQGGAKDIGIQENYAFRLVLKYKKCFSSKISYANIHQILSDDEKRLGAGIVYKLKNITVYGEYNSLTDPITTLGGFNLGENTVLISYGLEYYAGDNWKFKIRNESLDDDSSISSINEVFHTGFDYIINEKTSIMVEYQNIVGEGSRDNIEDFNLGVISKF